jgi:hypothetical protein
MVDPGFSLTMLIIMGLLNQMTKLSERLVSFEEDKRLGQVLKMLTILLLLLPV